MTTAEDGFWKLAGLAGLALAASAFFLPLQNPDLFWYFSSARHMLEQGAVPRADFLSWTMRGREWIDFEWLSQLAFYLLYELGGFRLLVLFKGALLTAAVFVTWRTAALGGAARSAWLYLPFLAAGMLTGGDIRAENFSLLFFALLIYRLERFRLGDAAPPRGTYFAAAAFFALWANLHAGYLYGLALFLIYFAGNLSGERGAHGPRRGAAYLKFFALGLAASLLNPYGWKLYRAVAEHQAAAAAMSEYIQEWGPVDILNIYQAPYFVMLAAACALALRRFFTGRGAVLLRQGFEGTWSCEAIGKRSRPVPAHLIAVAAFACAAALHRRFIPFFMLAALPYSLAAPAGETARGIKKHALTALQALAFAALAWHYGNIWSGYTGKAAAFPAYSEGLSDYLKSHKDRLAGLRLYNYWGWGGFLGYKLYPDYSVFMDGRYIFHDKLGETQSAVTPERWKALADKYGVGLAVVPAGGGEVPLKERAGAGPARVVWRPAWLARMPEKDWALVYWDRRALALVRRGAVNAAWLKGAEYKYLRAGDHQNMLVQVLTGRISLTDLEKEAQRFLRDDNAAFRAGAGGEVRALMGAVTALCADKGARCRR